MHPRHRRAGAGQPHFAGLVITGEGTGQIGRAAVTPFLQDAKVPAKNLLGAEGDGWNQVMSELAFERSGPERFLSSIELMYQLIAMLQGKDSDAAQITLGRLTAQLAVLRRLSRSVAAMLQDKQDAGLQAAIVKDVGAVWEQVLPDVARFLIYFHVMNGDLKSAAAMGERVSLVDPQMRGGWSLGGARSAEESVRDRVRMDCTKAYVAAALGNKAAAQAQLAGVGQYLDNYLGTDPRLSGEKNKPSKGKIREYEERLAIVTKQRELLGEWQDVAAKRENLPERTSEALMARFRTYKHTVDVLPALVEQIRHMATLVPAAEGAKLRAEADGLVRVLTGRMSRLAPESLGSFMPKPERLEQVPKLASSASKWLFSDGSGYSQAKEFNSDVRTVRYETLVGSKAMVEEMLLLAAANYARQEGKDGFVILSNRTLGRVTNYSGYGGNYTVDSGVESQARIMLVNVGALPADFASSADRVITVAEIERDIKPRYDGYMARKAAIAEAKKKKKG